MQSITKADGDKDLIINALSAHSTAVKSLGEALSYIDSEIAGANFGDRPGWELEKAELVSQLAKINSDFDAFQSSGGTISGPSNSELTTVADAAGDLDTMISNSAGVDGVVQGITVLINALHGGVDSAPAPGSTFAAALVASRS